MQCDGDTRCYGNSAPGLVDVEVAASWIGGINCSKPRSSRAQEHILTRYDRNDQRPMLLNMLSFCALLHAAAKHFAPLCEPNSLELSAQVLLLEVGVSTWHLKKLRLLLPPSTIHKSCQIYKSHLRSEAIRTSA